MKKFIIFIFLPVIVFVAGAFILTPNQKRFKDSDFAQKNIETPTQIGITKEEEAATINKPINIFYYKPDDTACKNLVSYEPKDIDNHSLYQEITALNFLLNKPVPEGYKTAIVPSTVLNQFTIRKGIGYIDLSIFLTLGEDPCADLARMAQLRATVMQFGSVTDVKFLVDGKEVSSTP